MSGRSYSLIVLTYNRPGPLDRCLSSIERLKWDGPPPEVVVVDDGSAPPAEAVAARHPSLNAVYVRKEHGGVSSARNKGIDASSGTHLAFIADDYALPADYLASVDAFFRDHPDADVISHSVDPRGPSLLRPVQRLYFDLAIGQEVPAEEVKKDASKSFTLPASRAAVFRRTVFDRVGRFDETIFVGEDGDFGNRLSRAGIPVYVFLRKRVAHYDAAGALDYFRQRIRYGRSYLRAGKAGPTRRAFSKSGTPAITLSFFERLGRKFQQWWEVAGRLGVRPRFVLLSPLLAVFLLFFYFGAYLELREITRREKEKR